MERLPYRQEEPKKKVKKAARQETGEAEGSDRAGAKKFRRVTLCVILCMVVFIAFCKFNHVRQLALEAPLREPLGQLVDVNGASMSVYTGGQGDTTLVFLAGGGTCSPILDFKSLYSQLEDEYRVAVVERFGYGFSDIVDVPRDIDSILEDSRLALQKAGVQPPYVLCPHSMSGLEALYWAQKYPEEVRAIVGLDMAVPAMYEKMDINLTALRFGQFAAGIGMTRLTALASGSAAIQAGTLTEEEQAIYRAVFYSRTATVTMINEAEAVKENAKLVASAGIPEVPFLLFSSNGSGGTGFSAEEWVSLQSDFADQCGNARIIFVGCGHYVHDYAYVQIGTEMREFLRGI